MQTDTNLPTENPINDSASNPASSPTNIINDTPSDSANAPSAAAPLKPRSEWDEDERIDGRPKLDRIQVLVVRPDEPPQVETLDNTLDAMQALVGGLITTFDTGIKGTIGVANDEALLHKMPANRAVPSTGAVIFGPLFIAGDGLNFHSLTPLQLELALEVFGPTLSFDQFQHAMRQHTESAEWLANWE